MLNPEVCRKARLARDPRFDGVFFTAVKTTKVYCRSICPAMTPKEENVQYYATAVEAAQAGYRPCLRCRPDSAPGSPAWKGKNTSFERALKLINEGALEEGSATELAERLGISTRYLRQLFNDNLGLSPKTYALYKQCLFAKQLLYQTALPITQVAQASGFKSIRRFNDCFRSQLKLTPSQVRKQAPKTANQLQMHLAYRPPYNWKVMQNFLAARVIEGLEWCDANSYGRNFQWENSCGHFTAHHLPDKHAFKIDIHLNDVLHLRAIVANIRRILDLDADSQMIDRSLQLYFADKSFEKGVRLPGTWALFEAGIRAILGQQVSILAARKLVTTLITSCGEEYNQGVLFPTPEAVFNHSLSTLKMPGARKNTLKAFSKFFLENDHSTSPEQWLTIKGIGPWTVNYAKLRGLSQPDIYLAGDLGVKKAEEKLAGRVNPESVSPWQSYLTFQLWSQL